MYPNPKTKRGQALAGILSALCALLPAFYILGVILLPFAPGFDDGNLIEIPSILTSFLLLVMTLSAFFFAFAVLLNIKRYVALATNKEGAGRLGTALNILYIALLFISMLGTLSLILRGNQKLSAELRNILTYFAWIWCPIISAALLAALGLLSGKEKKGRERPVFELNVLRSPLFYAGTALVVIALLCVPVSGGRGVLGTYERDVIYDRTNSFAYAYIRLEDRETHATLGVNFVLFPKNYLKTDELIDKK